MGIENLIENVDKQIIKIRTKSLDVSFNELYDMYENGELIITPDYQRLFRWGEEKQSRFIESLILEMPVPPIFVIEVEDGVYELIDGLQRISSYLHFRGKKLGETENEFLKLQGCDIVGELNDLSFTDLPKVLQIKIKRSFVRMEVIKKESEVGLKYHMFKRLNTGGELLSAQEIRNCTIRLLNERAINFIEECSQNTDFREAIKLIGKDKFSTKYDQELILRFLAIKNNIEGYKYPVTEYLTQYLEGITESDIEFDFKKEKEIFEKTFQFINKNWGNGAFAGKNQSGNARNEFVGYLFDGITIAVAKNIERIEKLVDKEKVVKAINKVKFGDQLRKYKTGSVNGLKTRIELFTEGVTQALDN
jgi:hypothetical protein